MLWAAMPLEAGFGWAPPPPWAFSGAPPRALCVVMPWRTRAAGEEITAAPWLWPPACRLLRRLTTSSPKPGTKR